MPVIYDIVDKVSREVDEATATRLLNDKSGRWQPASVGTAVAATEAANAAEAREFDTVGDELAAGANAFIGSTTLGLLRDDSATAKLQAKHNPNAALVGDIAGLVNPFNPANKVASVASAPLKAKRLLQTSKLARAGIGAAEAALETAVQDVVTQGAAVALGDRRMADVHFDAGTYALVGAVAGPLYGKAAKLSARADVADAFLAEKRGLAAKTTAATEEAIAAEAKAGEAVTAAADKLDNARFGEGLAARDKTINEARDKFDVLRNTQVPGPPAEQWDMLTKRVDEVTKTDIQANYDELYKRADDLERLQANVPKDIEAHTAAEARWNAAEQARVASVGANFADTVSPAVQSQRDVLRKTWEREVGKKQMTAYSQAGVNLDDEFNNWLLRKNRGDLLPEGVAQGHLSDAYMREISALGDAVPTTEAEFLKLFDDIAARNGYVRKADAKAVKQKTGEVVDAADQMFEGYLPEDGLRALDADEATRTYELYGQIGDASKRKMQLSAEQARQLSTGRMVQVYNSLDDAGKQVYLRALSPTTRFALLGKVTGVIGYADAKTLQSHALRTTQFSERAARTRAELLHSLEEQFVPTAEARIRPSLDPALAPNYVDNRPNVPARPYPGPKPKTDYSAELKGAVDRVNKINAAGEALRSLKLPKNPEQFIKMADHQLDAWVAAAKAAKASDVPEAYRAIGHVEESITSLLERSGLDAAAYATPFDGLRVLRNTHRNARAAHGEAIATAGRELRDTTAAAKAVYGDSVSKASRELAEAKKGLKQTEKATAGVNKTNALSAKDLENQARELGLVRREGGRLAPLREAAVIGSRYLGSKVGMMLGGPLGTLGKAAGFAGLGSLSAAAAKQAVSGGKRVMSDDAIVALARRQRRLAAAAEVAVTAGKRLSGSARGGQLAGRMSAVFPPDSGSAVLRELAGEDYGGPIDDESLMRKVLASVPPAAVANAAEYAYDQVKHLIPSNPKGAQALHEALTVRYQVLGEMTQEANPEQFRGYVKMKDPPLSRMWIAQQQRVLQALYYPTETLARAVETGYFPTKELNVIRRTSPDAFAEAQFYVAQKLLAEGPDGVAALAKLPYDSRRQYARFLDIQAEGSDTPAYIVEMQTAHAAAGAPDESDPAAKRPRGNAARPIEPYEQTAAQKTSQR